MIGLPKWPGIVVRGKEVDHTLAEEVIIRTDSFLMNGFGGNSRTVRAAMREALGFPAQDMISGERNDISRIMEAEQKVRDELGVLELGYLTNNRILTSYVGGPCGWMNWDGRVQISGHNIGKWPGVDVVEEEWKRIAAAFPELDLRCQLFDEESGNGGNPVVQYNVRAGEVQTITEDLDFMTDNQESSGSDAFLAHILSGRDVVDLEIGISPENLAKAVQRVRERRK